MVGSMDSLFVFCTQGVRNTRLQRFSVDDSLGGFRLGLRPEGGSLCLRSASTSSNIYLYYQFKISNS